MRSLRLVVLALAASAVVGFAPSVASAQQRATGWQDSWYWGAYGGYTEIPTVIGNTYAPTAGIDWVITRTRFALNVFAEQAYFNAVSTVPDFPTSAPRRVDITDMRRVGFSAMFFTPEWRLLKPYVGVGYAFNFIASGTPEGSFYASPAARDSVNQRVQDARAAGKVFANVGAMWMYRKFAPFIQYTVMPTKGAGNWFLNGEGFTNIWTIGLRYNFGSSIEK